MDMDKNKFGGVIDRRHHLVLVPCPLQGHINPMLHLANVLHSWGFSITIIQTKSTPISSLSHHSGFLFESIDDGLSEDEVGCSSKDVISFLFTLNSKCKAPFRDCLAKIIEDGLRCRVTCVIFDAVMYSSGEVARELGVPSLVLRTSTAANFLGLSLLNQKGSLPHQEHQRQKILQEFSFMKLSHMPAFNKSDQAITEKVLEKFHEGTKEATAIIWNTLEFLEHEFLERIEATLSVPIFPIGPIHKHSSAPSFSLLEEDRSCISWLDSHPPNSVLYVSTGSLIALTESELIEMAYGLADSNQPFLWVIRPGLVNGLADPTKLLPKEFKETIKGRGKIVKWAPQQEVLAHKSIGCFWTRNGWNSAMESICEGIPMLCWPYAGDQRMIAGFLSRVWKVGVQLDGEFERGNIANTIKKFLLSKEGNRVKKRVTVLQEKVELSLRQEGSSCLFLSKLVEYINLL